MPKIICNHLPIFFYTFPIPPPKRGENEIATIPLSVNKRHSKTDVQQVYELPNVLRLIKRPKNLNQT